jgi:chromosome segregation ATPase
MYFALGFMVAALLALMFLPAFWRRAMRLSTRRLQMLAPMSMEEVAAERDLLRAEFAVRERRLEQEMEALRAARVDDLAAIGRESARIVETAEMLRSAEAANRDLEALLNEARKTIAERTDLLHSTELALNEMTERAERDLAGARVPKPVGDADNHAAGDRVAVHEARIGAMHEENLQLEQALVDLRAEFDLMEEMAARVPQLEEELATATQEFTRLARELTTTQDARNHLGKALDTTRAEAEAAKRIHAQQIAQLESALRAARTEATTQAERLETARTDNAMLNGALTTLRAERAALRRGVETDDAPPIADPEIESLRAAIVDFGDRVAAAPEPPADRR